MPTPKKQTKRKTTSVEPCLSADNVGISKAEKTSINNLIAQSLIRYKDEQLLDKKQKFKEIGHLASMCEEYLSSFALIGYSLEGERVVVFSHPTSKDEAALVDLLRTTLINLLGNQ